MYSSREVLTPVGIVGVVLAGIFGLALVWSLLNPARLRTARSIAYAPFEVKIPNMSKL